MVGGFSIWNSVYFRFHRFPDSIDALRLKNNIRQLTVDSTAGGKMFILMSPSKR